MDRLGSSVALTPLAVGFASPPECLSGAAADERYRTRSKQEAQTTIVALAKGSVVDNASQFSHFSAAGRAWNHVSLDLADSDKWGGVRYVRPCGAYGCDVARCVGVAGCAGQSGRIREVRCWFVGIPSSRTARDPNSG